MAYTQGHPRCARLCALCTAQSLKQDLLVALHNAALHNAALHGVALYDVDDRHDIAVVQSSWAGMLLC